MRVCLVSDGLPPDCGGAPLSALRLTHHLQTAEGIEAGLIAWDRFSDRSANFSLPANVYPVKLRFRGDDEGAQAPIQMVKQFLHLGELAARLGAMLFTLRHRFDVLHVINAATWFCLMTVPLAKLLGKRVIIEMVLVGSDDPLKLNERAAHPEQQLFPHRPLKYSMFLQADAYVSISPALSAAYSEAGLPPSKLYQIPLGVDTGRFRPSTPNERRALRHKLGLNEEKTIILFVGVIDERKGVRLLLEAFRQIALNHPETQLLVVGPSLPPDAAYLQAIHQSITVWDMNERVHLVSRMVDNVHEYMRASDIFCLPTKREGFGAVIIEAMAAGLPVVVSRLEGVTTEIVRSDREGILVPVGDTTKLADALTKLVRNPALRSRLGQAARRRVLREFSFETYLRRYLSLYKRMANGVSAHR